MADGVLTVSRSRDEQGAVAVMVSIVAVVLFVIAAMVVDLGLARDTRRQSQNTADAAALAAGNKLYDATGHVQFATAVSEAKSYSLTNFDVALSDWAACTDPGALAFVPASSTPCISFDSATAPTLVRVKVPLKTLKPGLGTLSGIRTITVDSAARVALEPPGLPCIVCVLGSGQTHDLQNGDVTVDGGNVHFNGSVSVNTNGFVVTNGNITVEGTASPNPTTNFTPDAQPGQPAIGDPLSYLTLPPDAMSTLTVKSDPCVDGPGKYGTFNLPNALCTLQPGLYVIAGGAGTQWALGGNDTSILAGTGVTLYFTCGTPAVPTTCAPGTPGATLDATGNGSMALSPPTSGPLKGVAIAFDRNNTATLRLTGSGMSDMKGAIYLKSGELQMNGNGCSESNSPIVVNSIEMNGNPACLAVAADPNSMPVPPPSELHLDQ
jgi:Flp pilus assembly protein TadG